jgi:peptide/nickel transport system permease protein
MGFKQYAVKRILEAVPAILGILIIGFLAVHLTPGDPAQYIAGESASPEEVAFIRQHLGLDKPFLTQFLVYLQNFLRGDLGYSFVQAQPVADLIWQRLPNTIMLVLCAYAVALAFGVMLGVLAASKPYSTFDNITSILALTAYGMPGFWVGQLLILAFAVYLPIFPSSGMSSVRVANLSGADYVMNVAWHLVLPVLTLALVDLAEQFRITRGAMLEILHQDFVTTARAKGVSEVKVLFKHALRNALLPVVTITGLRVGSVFTGAILTETVYGWPGVGRLMFTSVFARDYPMILGCFTFISVFVVGASLVTDLCYAYLDPRIRYQ